MDHAADHGLRAVDELEAGDVRPTLPQVCQVNVQEALRQEVDGKRDATIIALSEFDKYRI